jgi:hypothetical protein
MLSAPTISIYAAAKVTTRHHFRQPDSSKQFREKKLSEIVIFSEIFGILEKHHVSNGATENTWFVSNLICIPGNGPK